MRKNLLAAAVASAILTLSPAVKAAVVDVSSDKTLTYDAPSTVTDSHNVTSGTLIFDAGVNNLTFTSASKENHATIDSQSNFYIQNGDVKIKAGTLTFESANATTNDPGNTAGDSHFSAWLDGNARLTIDQGRVGEAANVVSIGSAERRVGRFESHTSWGDQDYGVAILQANEGSAVSLFAKEVVLDGSHHTQGGVIGSGSFGTVLVDADKVTIDGNICGTYGTTKYAGKELSTCHQSE